MHAHSQFCWSGDHTLEATEMAINSVAEQDSDEAIVVILSDANLQRYGIPPAKLASALTAKSNVSAYVIFIGSLGDQAERYINIIIVKVTINYLSVCSLDWCKNCRQEERLYVML